MKQHAILICLSSCLLMPIESQAGSAKQIGDFGRFASPLLAVLVTLSKHDTEGAQQFGKSLTSSLLLTHALKRGIREERPRLGSNNSFPSGHATCAFCGANYLQQRYGWRFAIPGYFIASAVGLSRVETRAHHVHDILAAAALSSALTYLFTKPLYSGKVTTNASAIISTQKIGFNLNINVDL